MSRFAALVLALTGASLAGALSFDVAAAKEHPVSAVVKLLTEMKADLEKEADQDEAVYEKLACWCETNDKGKTKAIAEAEERVTELSETIQKKAALSAQLKVEIAAEEKEIEEMKKALATATAMREKEQAEFLAEEKEMIESIRALKSAVLVLQKQQGKSASFLSSKVVVQAYATAKVMMERHYDLLAGIITPSERKAMTAFMQQGQPEDYFDAKPTFSQSYAPQSGEIFGILNQMKETFENNLSQGQKDEIAAQETFAELKKSKEAEIAAGEESVETKKQQLADSDRILAQSKEDLEDTFATLSADKKFLRDLIVKCKMTDKEWDERQKMRQAEIEACAKAIEILSTDEAREQFSKTFNPSSFLQIRKENNNKRSQALARLAKVASKSPKLAAIAVSLRLDPFPRVKKAIDDMVAQLLKEKEEEIAEKDFCVKNLNENTRETAEEEHVKKRLENKIAALEQTIKEQTEAIETLDKEMADLDAAREQASKDRVAEKDEYEQTVADQQKSKAILVDALKVLKDVYKKASERNDVAMLQQNPEEHAVAVGGKSAPKDFDSYEKNRASAGIIAMIEQIITDCDNMTKEAQRQEQLALDSFTKFVQTTNESLAAKQDAKVDLQAQKAQSEKELTAAKQELKGTMKELESLANEKGDLKKQCDFLLANFEINQKARDEEVDALRGAKAFLSGMQKQ